MKIVIIGAGFAGLKLARSLNNKPGFEVLLLEKFNYHQFQPLFYQVATAGLDASNISFPLRKAFQRSKNVRIRMAKVEEIKTHEQVVVTNIGEFEYDRVVIASGADTNWFGNQKLIDNAYGMKSTVEALQIRHKLLQNFEDVVKSTDPLERKRLMNIVVVGGGPTGVEMAGAIAEMRKYVLPRDYPEIDFADMNIFLLEGGPKTLGPMSEKSSEQSQRYLERLGVIVRTNTILKDYDGDTAILSTGDTIETSTVIWAAGVRGNVPKGIDPSLVVRGNRIKVDRFNKVLGTENIYALGDVAYMETPKYPTGHPQVANVAINQAKNLANNLRWEEMKSSKNLKEFEYHDKGSMATVGRNLAVVDIPRPKLHFGGFFAWLIWMGLHLVLILGVKNRLVVFINWVYNYITYDQSLRLIFNEFCRPRKKTEQEEPQQKHTLETAR
ncbi:NAD(P)/FAD-dependent oxidoreductase [Aridibaculum aurantiacum]|uniref:NAD(P)/FAD-dependent oxidoreductase n=1 Tax=Aridibaculum aurantiacum TaxID=2810307 RepID=UPI001A96EB0D|nr:NAD(P)/FAD-dependent oxidoreductase [Aridibaculum aurantiacum]